MTPRRDSVAMMLDIADRFMSQAAELDQRVSAAIEADASHGDIVALMNLAATDRLRALACCQSAAPFVSPKLQAVEISPISASTQSRFEARLAEMPEAEILRHLQGIADRTLRIEHLEADDE